MRIVAETLYVPAANITTWFLPLHPSRAFWIALDASPPCGGTLAHVCERTGRPSGPSAAPVVSLRMPGFHVVVYDGSTRPGGTMLHAPPSHVGGVTSTSARLASPPA